MKPLNKMVQLDIKDVKIGAIQSDSIAEKGTILRISDDCTRFTNNDVGRELYFKAWAVNIITDGDKKMYFIHEDSEAICAFVA